MHPNRITEWLDFAYWWSCIGKVLRLQPAQQAFFLNCLRQYVNSASDIYQALRFRGFCCSGSQLQNWALCNQSFEPNSNISLKKWKLAMGKVYINNRHRKNIFWHCAIFSLKTPKKIDLSIMKNTFSMKLCFRAKKIYSQIDWELLLHANLTKHIGSLYSTPKC